MKKEKFKEEINELLEPKDKIEKADEYFSAQGIKQKVKKVPILVSVLMKEDELLMHRAIQD